MKTISSWRVFKQKKTMTEGLFDSENFQKLKIASSLIPNYLKKKNATPRFCLIF
jgi:hypothetical protein